MVTGPASALRQAFCGWRRRGRLARDARIRRRSLLSLRSPEAADPQWRPGDRGDLGRSRDRIRARGGVADGGGATAKRSTVRGRRRLPQTRTTASSALARGRAETSPPGRSSAEAAAAAAVPGRRQTRRLGWRRCVATVVRERHSREAPWRGWSYVAHMPQAAATAGLWRLVQHGGRVHGARSGSRWLVGERVGERSAPAAIVRYLIATIMESGPSRCLA